MRVKWNRQLDGSLARGQAEEDNGQGMDKECKQKNSPKLFRLFRRKKQKNTVPPGPLARGPDAPSEMDEDDCASVSSIATVASQPTAEVCQRDRTLSIFSSFRLNFPGGKKKSKRIVTVDNDPLFREPSRYSSPDLRRERLDESCGQLSSSSPSVKDASKQARMGNDDLVKHCSTNCVLKVAQEKLVDQTTLSKSSPSFENSVSRQNGEPFNPKKQFLAKKTLKTVGNKFSDDQVELSQSTPSVKVRFSGLEEIGDSFTSSNLCNSKRVQLETKNKAENYEAVLIGTSRSTSSFKKSITDLQNGILNQAKIAKLDVDQNKQPKSISTIKDTVSCDLRLLEHLRAENSNSLNQLKIDDDNGCAQKNMRSAKSVSFYHQNSLSPDDVTCVEADIFPNVNGSIKEDSERKFPAHSSEPSCRSKSTHDDSPESLQTVSGGNRSGKVVLCVLPDSNYKICDKRNALCDMKMKNCDFLNGEASDVCCNDSKLHLKSVDKSDKSCGKIRDSKCEINEFGANILSKICEDSNGDVYCGDFNPNSITTNCLNESFNSVWDETESLISTFSEETQNDINVTVKRDTELLPADDSANLVISSSVTSSAASKQDQKNNDQPIFRDKKDSKPKNTSHESKSSVLRVEYCSPILNDVDVKNCESSLTRRVSESKISKVEFSVQDNATSNNFCQNSEGSNILSDRTSNFCNNLAIKNESQSSHNLFKISNSCIETKVPNAELSHEYTDYLNLQNLSLLNNESNFPPDIYTTNESTSSLETVPQYQTYSKNDYFNMPDDYFLRLKFDLTNESLQYPPEVRKRNVLNFKPSDAQLDFLKNNMLSDFGSYLHKLKETGASSANFFDRQVIVWNASLVQNIISRHFPAKEWLLQPLINSNDVDVMDPPFISTTVRGKYIVSERCPDVSSVSSLEDPPTVTVPDHDLHIDTPQFPDRRGRSNLTEDNTATLSTDVGTTSFGLSCDGVAYQCRQIYDQHHISTVDSGIILENNAESALDSFEGNSLTGEKCSELNVQSSEAPAEAECLKSGLEHGNEHCATSQESLHDSVQCSTLDVNVEKFCQVPIAANSLTRLEMRRDLCASVELIDSLPEETSLGEGVVLKNGFSSGFKNGMDYLDDKNVACSQTTSNCLTTEIGNNVDVERCELIYKGVKNKIKMFESGSCDVESAPSKTSTTPNKLQQPRNKHNEKSKISMIPSLRKGIPTPIKTSYSKSSKGKKQNQKDNSKEIICRTLSNESQTHPTKPHLSINSSSSSFKVNDSNLETDSEPSTIPNIGTNTKTPSDLGITEDPMPEKSNVASETSNRSESEEFLLDSISEFPVSNSNLSNRRHSSAAVFEPTADFFQIKNGALGYSDSESAQIAPSECQSSNLTLDEICPSVLDSSFAGLPVVTKRGLHSRCSSLPLVIGQVHGASPSMRNYIIKDGPRGTSRIPRKHGGMGRAGTHLTSKQPVRPPMWLSKAELTQEIQRLGTLCEARTKELNRLKMETRHVTVGFDAFAALFKYMVEDVNGLSVPKLSEELEKTLKQLELAKQDLAYYEREVEEMKAHHCQELNDLSNKLFEVFQGEVTELGTKHQEEINRMKIEHEQQLKATSETYEAGYEETQASHEAALMKLQQELINQREELQLFHKKELVELEEKHSQSTKTLQEHIEQLQKKCAELKHHSLGMEDAMRKDTDTKLQWVTSRKGDLEKEVESLKAVLEMKNKELHTLRVQTLEMEKQLEELPLAREKIKMLSARAEDLEALMIEKTRVERKLSNENQTIKDTYEKESKVNKRLSMENEELQWRLRQAEQSIISGSFTDVAESAEETENGALSPAKSPHQMSRSVFFTFVDKDNVSSPRSQYKKITPGFSSGYKTSPSKSSRNRGLSEPMQPSSISTPKKGVKTSLKQKRQRANTNIDNGGAQSFASSMVSSVGSECSVFDQKEGFLEEHEEQIIETLEILREQRCSEEKDESSDNWQNSETLGDTVAMRQEQNGEHLLVDVSAQKESTKGLVEQRGKLLALDYEKMMFSESSPEIASEPMTPSDLGDVPCQKEPSDGLVEQCGKFLDLGSEKIRFSESSPDTESEPITPSDKWQEEVARNGGFNGDEMSRSAEFSDPKTYYHMTFPVLKEAGAVECDGEDSNKAAGHNFATAQATHSMVESSVEVDSRVVQVSKEVSSEVAILSLQGNGASMLVEKVTQENALIQSCHSTQESGCNIQSRDKNRWRTM